MYKLVNKAVKGLSPLTINRTAENKMKIYPYGYTHQETRSGKNLFKLPNSATNRGITYTKNEDGTFNITGTSTETSAYFIIYEDINKLGFISGNNYRMTLNQVLNGISIRVEAYNDTGWLAHCISLGSGYTNASYAVTIPEGTTRMRYIIEIPTTGTTVDYSNVQIQLEEGTSKTEFEQYGASPSPEYPSEIRNVGDNINLFDKDNVITIKAILQSSTFKVVGNNDTKLAYLKVKPNTTYTVSKVVSTRFALGSCNGVPIAGTTVCNAYIAGNTESKLTITTTENDDYLCIYYYYSQTDTLTEQEILDSIKLEEGSIATSYSEYGCGSVGFKVENKNKLNKNNVLNAFIDGSAKKVISSNSTRVCYIKCKPNKSYTISKKISSRFLVGTTTEIPINNSIISDLKINNDATKITITSSNNAKYLCVYYYHSSYDTLTEQEILDSIQIEEGDTATDYVEHQEQIVVFPLAQGQLLHQGDYLAEDGIHYNRNTLVFDGTENWIKSNTTEVDRYLLNVSNDFIWKTTNVLNTHFSFKANSTVVGTYWIDTYGASRIMIQYAEYNTTTLEEWKTYLAEQYANGTPITIEYELAEEVVIPYTEEQKYVLNHIYSYEEVTNISTINEFNFEMDISYTPQFLKEMKDKFIKGPTFGRIHIIDTNEDFTQDNYLKDFTITEPRFIPNKGLFGGCVAKKVDVNFNNVNKQFSIQDKEFEAYLGVDYEGERYEIKYGTFIVQHPETEEITDNTSFTALDYMTKFNQIYVDRIKYPCTLRELAEDICNQVGGVILSEEKFRNQDFIVENNQFVNGENLRQVLQGIALSAFSWARIDENNELHFDLNQKEDIDIELTADEYYNLSKDDYLYGPINRVIIRDSQVEGENVTVEDETLQNYPIGNNLFNIELWKNMKLQATSGIINVTDNEVILENPNGVDLYTLSGMAVAGSTLSETNRKYVMEVKPNTTYILSFDVEGTEQTNKSNNSCFYSLMDKNYKSTFYRAMTTFTVPSSKNITIIKTESDTKYIGIRFGMNKIIEAKISYSNIQLKQGEEFTDYEPAVSNGICELVIEDNPFAYTQEKREQLIEAGKELFGFRYLPVNEASLIGLAFLSNKDKIRFTTLDGKVFDTYLFDHTIKYNGTISDSVQSKGLTKTETKYIYKPEISQKVKRTEIIVDKQNQTINSIIEKQDEQGQKITKQEQTLEGVETSVLNIETRVEEVQEQTDLNTDEIAKLGSTETVEGTELTVNASNNPAKICVYGNTEQKNSTASRNICPNEWVLGQYATDGTVAIYDNRIRVPYLIRVQPNTTYYVNTFRQDETYNVNFILRGLNASKVVVKNYSAIANMATFTTGADEYYLAITIYSSNNATVDILNLINTGYIRPFICLNSETDKTYTEFIPDSPSPEYPSEIRNVGDNINLFDGELELGTLKNEDGTTNANNSCIRSVNYTQVNSNNIYTISNDKNYAQYIYEYDKDKTFIKYTANTNSKFTFTTSETTKYIKFRTTAGDVQNDLTTLFKIEKGKVATTWSEYGCGNIGLQIDNKNVLGYKKNGTITYNGLTITYEDGIFTLNGKSEYNGYLNLTDILKVASNNVEMDNQPKKKLHNGKYTFSYNYISGTKDNTGFHFYIRDTASSSNTINHNLTNLHLTNTQKTFNITELDYVCYIWVSLNVTFTNFKFSFQLEKGETKTDWVQHKQRLVIFPFAEGQLLHKGDYLAEDGIHQGRKTIKLTGTERWTKHGSTNVYYCNDNILSDIKLQVGTGTLPNLICSHFKTDTVDHTWNKQVDNTITAFPDGTVNPRICMNQCTTADQFKSYLAEQYANGIPVTVEYELAEEIIIPYTPEQQKVLDSVETFKGINHIYCIDEITPEKIILTYYPNTPFNDTLVNKDTFDKVTSEMNAEFNIRANEVETSVREQTTANILTLLNNGYLTAEQVKALVNGNAEDIATVKEQLTQTVTNSQMQIEITKAIEGGVSYLKNTLFTIDENGMTIATNQDEFNAKYNNKGMYLYSYDELIANFDVNGTTIRGNLNVNGELITPNLRMINTNVDGVPHTHIHWIGG